MAEKLGAMREQIEATKSEISEDLASLESQLRGKVDSVKEDLRKISPSHQIQENPLWALGGSILAGIAIGGLISGKGRSASSQAPADPGKPREPGKFDDEWKLVKGVVMGAIARNFAKVAKQAAPSLQHEIDDVIGRIASKVEGTPQHRPEIGEGSAKEWSPGSGADAPTPEGEAKSYH